MITVEITEEQRQIIVLALAQLSMKYPGWDYTCNEIASSIDNVVEGRAKLYDDFRQIEKLSNEADAAEVVNA
jgi:hypothetical protein